MSSHRYDYKNWKNDTMNYITSFELLKYEDCYIELVEQGEFNSKQEMEKREGYFIREMVCVNKYIAGRTNKEWRNDNAVDLKEKAKEYYVSHKDQIQSRTAKYRATHKEEKKESNAKYKSSHKEQIQEHKSKKCMCTCGLEYTHSHKSRHEMSSQHINKLKLVCQTIAI